jgi:hypothetical protein
MHRLIAVFAAMAILSRVGVAASNADGPNDIALKNLTLHHAYLGVSLSFDEKCHLMSASERQTIQSEWEESQKLIRQIPDVKARLNLLAQSNAVEDDLMQRTACGPQGAYPVVPG